MDRKGLILLAGGALILAALIVGMALTRSAPKVSRQAEVMKAGLYEPPASAPDFSLQGSDGSVVRLSQYRGKVVLLTFGFTYCAAVCPTTLSTLAQARQQLGKAASHVQVVFVTVDPARDTAAQMAEYLKAFDPTFIGATGDASTLAAVRQKYGVTAVKQGNGPDYAMGHTSSIFLIDRAGKLRAMMPFGRDASDFVHDINYLLAQ